MIKPILLYLCKVWGVGNLSTLEKVQLKFLKYIFKLKRSTPSFMLHGELGITPIALDANCRVISFWSNIIEDKNTNDIHKMKLSTKLYIVVHHLKTSNTINSQWLNNVQNLLSSLGYSGVWDNQTFPSRKWLQVSTKQKLKDVFIQNWHANIDQTSSSSFYKQLNREFNQNNCLNLISSFQFRQLLAFITRNHRLPIETGRWRSIPTSERKCSICNDIGDEFHYLFICPLFDNERKKYIKPYYYLRPNTFKLSQLFGCKNVKTLRSLSIFASIIMKYFAT